VGGRGWPGPLACGGVGGADGSGGSGAKGGRGRTPHTLGAPKGQSVGVAGASASRRVPLDLRGWRKLHCTARGELDGFTEPARWTGTVRVGMDHGCRCMLQRGQFYKI